MDKRADFDQADYDESLKAVALAKEFILWYLGDDLEYLSSTFHVETYEKFDLSFIHKETGTIIRIEVERRLKQKYWSSIFNGTIIDQYGNTGLSIPCTKDGKHFHIFLVFSPDMKELILAHGNDIEEHSTFIKKLTERNLSIEETFRNLPKQYTERFSQNGNAWKEHGSMPADLKPSPLNMEFLKRKLNDNSLKYHD